MIQEQIEILAEKVKSGTATPEEELEYLELLEKGLDEAIDIVENTNLTETENG